MPRRCLLRLDPRMTLICAHLTMGSRPLSICFLPSAIWLTRSTRWLGAGPTFWSQLQPWLTPPVRFLRRLSRKTRSSTRRFARTYRVCDLIGSPPLTGELPSIVTTAVAPILNGNCESAPSSVIRTGKR